MKPKIDRDIQVVKVQRPAKVDAIFTRYVDGKPVLEPTILIYDRFRRHEQVVHDASLPDWLILALAKSPTLFARAAWAGDHWEFVGAKQAAAQSW